MEMEDVITILIFGFVFVFNLVRSVREEKKKKAKRDKGVVEPTPTDEEHQNRQEMNRPQQPTMPTPQPTSHPTNHHDVNRPVADQCNHSEVERMEEALRKQREKYAEEERRRDEARRKAMEREKEQMNRRMPEKKKVSSAFLSGEGDVCSVHHEELTPMAPIEDEMEMAPIDLKIDDPEEFRRAFVYSEILNRKY